MLILSGLTVSLFSQDKQISGIINIYRHVTQISQGSYNVTLNNADSINSRDTVLLIQMKGVRIYVPNDNNYGFPADTMGAPGSCEFLIVQSVNTGTKVVTFTSSILKSYKQEGMVQLIRVPFYNSATVKAELTCQAWDSTSKTGGVLAMIIGKTLSLNSNINVAGKGFAGGTPFQGQGICISTNAAAYDSFSYPVTYQNSGFKGESQAIKADLGAFGRPSIFPSFVKGKGANFTGGGGGNGKFSGGGGGANYGKGGTGGNEIGAPEIGACSDDPGAGGIRGIQIKTTDLEGGIFLGGGGGSSTYEVVSAAKPGGRGGGIVIILCDTLKGKGKIINADGEQPSPVLSGNGGAGGGGGGGSIALFQQSFSTQSDSSALTISANGGKGGNNSGTYQNGGGGGGGLVLINNILPPLNVKRSASGGEVGDNRNTSNQSGTNGAVGDSIRTNFVPVLNGFLFNSIRSSVSGNQMDSVCSGMLLPKITGTVPVGGTGSYTYVWEKSYDRTFSSTDTLTNDTDPTNYTPKMADASTPTDSVWFRRTISDNGPPFVIDYGNLVKFVVHPAIVNNKIGNQDTICFNGDPLLIQQLTPDLVVPTTKYFIFNWQDSTTTSTWGSTIATTKNFDPLPGLVKTTWYRRTVKSGSCIDFSSTAKVKITVLNTISNNKILSLPQDICYGMTFTDLSATIAPVLAGGDNSYRFSWESSLNGTTWVPATGANTLPGYNPDELSASFPGPEYYRRIVKSGIHDVCINTSAAVLLGDFPVLTNNLITSSLQTICSGMTPSKLVGSLPLNGNGTYTFTWQDSSKSHTWNNIPGATNISVPDYQPPALPDTTSYRRIVTSSACADTSKSVIVNVHKPIVNSISLLSGGAPDTTICNGQKPNMLSGLVATGGTNNPASFTYQWLYSTDNFNFIPVVAGGTNPGYAPSNLGTTTYFQRLVTSGACIDQKSPVTITVIVLQSITNNIISASQSAVCMNTVPGPVTGGTLSGGSGTYLYFWKQSADGGATWTDATGTDTLSSYQPPVLINPVKYKRIVNSGLADCCSSTSAEVDIGINPLPGKPDPGTDTTIHSVKKIYKMKASPPLPGETGAWIMISGDGKPDDNSNNTIVRNLSAGANEFLWTVTKGTCTLDSMVLITLLEDFIPQGFSPNGDIFNNTFIIEGLNLTDQVDKSGQPDQIVELSVVNGAGTEVFSTSNRTGQTWNNWDGKNSKGIDLPEGTYYYLLKITPNDKGKVIRKSGFIVLKRY